MTQTIFLYSDGFSSTQAVYVRPFADEASAVNVPDLYLTLQNFDDLQARNNEAVWTWSKDGALVHRELSTGNLQIVATVPRVIDSFGNGSTWDTAILLPDSSILLHPSGGLDVHRVTLDGNVQVITLPAPAFTMSETAQGRGRIGGVGYRTGNATISILFGNGVAVPEGSSAWWVYTEIFAPSDGATPALYTPAGVAGNGLQSFQAFPMCAAFDDRVSADYVYLSATGTPATPLGGGATTFLSADPFGGLSVSLLEYAFVPTAAATSGYSIATFSSFSSTAVPLGVDVLSTASVITDNFDATAQLFFGSQPVSPPATPEFWTAFIQTREII
jgi:hypothetical protein